VHDLVQAMGLAGIGKSAVNKLCKDIDDRVGAFLDRLLVGGRRCLLRDYESGGWEFESLRARQRLQAVQCEMRRITKGKSLRVTHGPTTAMAGSSAHRLSFL